MYVRMDQSPNYDDSLAFDGWFSKAAKKVGGVAKKAAAIVAAPMVIPSAAIVKAATHVAAKTGWDPAERLNSKVTDVWRGDTLSLARKSFVAQMAVGAAVGGAVLAAPAVGSAIANASPTTLLSNAGSLFGGSQPATSAAPVAVAQAAPTQPAATAQPVAVATPAGAAGGPPAPVLAAGAGLLWLLFA